MHIFQDGEEARILKRGVEAEAIVFHQSGEIVYVFDRENRPYQFHVESVVQASVAAKALRPPDVMEGTLLD